MDGLTNRDMNKQDVHVTRLKDDILTHFGSDMLEEKLSNGHVVLVFHAGLGMVLEEELKKRNFSREAQVLAEAANIVMRDMFDNMYTVRKADFSRSLVRKPCFLVVSPVTPPCHVSKRAAREQQDWC